ncbi:MAG: HAD family hydrolase [Clostridia bacterium]|jgi:beta-phosphoglucomutase|nr:HAD-IA family hydrolase [Clostridiaceae bacterium]
MKDTGIIFDMDGVLVDSEPVIRMAAIRGLKEYGVFAKPEDFDPFVGAGEDRFVGGVSEKYGVPYVPEMKALVYKIYGDLVEKHLKIYAGVPEMLVRLSKKGYRLALASSADMIKVKLNLKTAGIAFDLFQAVLTGEDVVRKKPAPDIFLKGGERLGLPSENCWVVEDAVNGIQAAKAAGMRCIAITSSFPRKRLEAEKPDYIFDSTLDIETIF